MEPEGEVVTVGVAWKGQLLPPSWISLRFPPPHREQTSSMMLLCCVALLWSQPQTEAPTSSGQSKSLL